MVTSQYILYNYYDILKKYIPLLFIFYILTMVFSILMTVSCASKYRPDLKGKAKSAERIKLVKNFATEYFAKCEKQDYSEFQGYKMDVNLKKKLDPESFKKSCEYYNSRYGTITIG